jgi:VanZ family protein
MKTLCQFLLRTMPYIFVFGMILTTVLLLIELAPSESHWPYLDKLEHATAFFMLASSASLGFPKHAKPILIGLVFYGALMEVLQSLLTVTRDGSFLDLLADLAGILIWMIIAMVVKRVSNKSLVTS